MDAFWATAADALPEPTPLPMEVEHASRAAEQPQPAQETAPQPEHAPHPTSGEPAQPEHAPAAAAAPPPAPWETAAAARPAAQPAPALKPQSGFGPSLPERGGRPGLAGVKGLGLGSSLQRTGSGTPSSSAPGSSGRPAVVGLKPLPLPKRVSGTGSGLAPSHSRPAGHLSGQAAPVPGQQQDGAPPEHTRLSAEGLTQKRLGLLTQASHSWARPPVPVAEVPEGSVDTSGTEDADMSPGGQHGAGASYPQTSESPPGENEGFAAPPDLAAVPPNTRLPVVCNGNRGLFVVHRQVVVCLCDTCRARAAEVGHPEIELTPTDFERHSGHMTSKKWKYTIKVMENTSIGFVATMNMGTWLDKYCPSLAKGSGCRGKTLPYSAAAYGDLAPTAVASAGGAERGGRGGGGGGGVRKRAGGPKRPKTGRKDGSDSPSPVGGGGAAIGGPPPLQGMKDEPAAAAAANMASPASLASPSSKKWLNTADADIKVPDKPEIREGARFQARVPPYQGPRPAGQESQDPRAGWPGPSTLEALALAASYEKRASDALHIDAVADPEYHPGGVHDVRNLMVERGQRKRRKPQWLATSANPMEQPLRALNPSRPVIPPAVLEREREREARDSDDAGAGPGGGGGGGGGAAGPTSWRAAAKPAAKRNKSAEPPARDAPPKRPRTTLAPVREARPAAPVLPVLSAPPPPLVTAEGGLRVLDWQVIGDGFMRITVSTPEGVYTGALMPQPGVPPPPPPPAPPALHALMAGLAPVTAPFAVASAIPPHMRAALPAAAVPPPVPLLAPAPASAQVSAAEPQADAAAAVATGRSARSGASGEPKAAAAKAAAKAQAFVAREEAAASKSASPEVAANSGVPAASSGAFQQPEGTREGAAPAAPAELSAQPSGDLNEVNSDRWEAAKQSTVRPGGGKHPNNNRRALASREYDRLSAEGPPKDAKCALCRQGPDPAYGLACRTEEGGSHLDSSMTERREGSELGPLMLVKVSAIMNAWVHVQCALWSPEVYVNDDGSVERASEAVRRGRMIKCKQCGEKGATLGCHRRSCRASFHLPCARAQNCLLQGSGEEDYMVTCKEHKAGVLGEADFLPPAAAAAAAAAAEQKPAASGGGAKGPRRSLDRGGSNGTAAAERRRSLLSGAGQAPTRPRA